jgi:hypothetical protein
MILEAPEIRQKQLAITRPWPKITRRLCYRPMFWGNIEVPGTIFATAPNL